MKTDATLRLTRTQYRHFAELAKQASCCLSLSTFTEMNGAWGMFNPLAQLTCANASSSDTGWDECCGIQLATSVDLARLRSAVRPELDWGALEDHEVYPFITAHEIGHRVDNFNIFDAWGIEEIEVQQKCEGVMRMVNEVLADRYAWQQIRPGEPLPLSETGRRGQRFVADSLALLDRNLNRRRRPSRALPAGQYTYVPQSMLVSDSMVAYVGPRVSPALVERVREKRRIYRRDTRSRAFA